jgi:hypothetical protein
VTEEKKETMPESPSSKDGNQSTVCDGTTASALVKNPNAGTADPTDGRKRWDWSCGYPPEARRIYHGEAMYLVFFMLAGLALVLFSWTGHTAEFLGVKGHAAITLKKYCYYVGAGAVGGAVFSIKFMYRVIARGYWHLDRQMWRFLSPVVALGVAFGTGALIEASLVSGHAPSSGSAIVGTGFIIGYFADQAIAKMYEVAMVLFGTTSKSSESK